jgi:hypothetical protein
VLLPPSITIRSQVSDSPAAAESRLPELAPPPNRSPAPRSEYLTVDHLPIFEQARSDWFESPANGPSSPRRHPQPAATQASGNGTAQGPEDVTAAAEAVQAANADPAGDETTGMEAPSADAVQAPEPEAPGVPPEVEQPVATAFGAAEGDPFAEAEAGEPLEAPLEAPPQAERPRPERPQRPDWLDDAPRLPRREPRERADLEPEPERPMNDPRVVERPIAERSGGRSRPLGDPFGPPLHPFGTPQDPFGTPQDPFGSTQDPLPPLPPLPEQRPPFMPAQHEAAAPASPLPQRQRPVPQPPPQPDGQPVWQPADEARGPQQPPGPESRPGAPTDVTAPLPPTLQPASVPTTKAGLPRRVPRANLAPGMVAQAQRATSERPAAPPPSGFSRSPEEVRSMLSSYRTGLERGRRMAAGDDLDDRGEGARSGFGGTAPMAPRSDDDAAQ